MRVLISEIFGRFVLECPWCQKSFQKSLFLFQRLAHINRFVTSLTNNDVVTLPSVVTSFIVYTVQVHTWACDNKTEVILLIKCKYPVPNKGRTGRVADKNFIKGMMPNDVDSSDNVFMYRDVSSVCRRSRPAWVSAGSPLPDRTGRVG